MLKMCDSPGLQESQIRYNILVQWPPRAENLIQISPQIFSLAKNVPNLSKLSLGGGVQKIGILRVNLMTLKEGGAGFILLNSK